MKTIAKTLILMLLLSGLSGCAQPAAAQIAATTLPVYQFTDLLCQGTPLTVTRLVTESVSCLHDYSLTVNQMKAIEGAQVVVISGAGLEEFMEEALENANAVIDSSVGIPLLEGGCHHGHDHEEAEHHSHEHTLDAHIWLSPANAMAMAENICAGLSRQFPEYADTFAANLIPLLSRLQELDAYGRQQLSDLRSREIITFHDGFAYLAHEYNIEILEAIEEESGAEASAQELIELIKLVRHHDITAIFVETNGSGSAASIIAGDTGCGLFTLDMAMSGEDYFSSMYANIHALKEALQ